MSPDSVLTPPVMPYSWKLPGVHHDNPIPVPGIGQWELRAAEKVSLLLKRKGKEEIAPFHLSSNRCISAVLCCAALTLKEEQLAIPECWAETSVVSDDVNATLI